MRYVPKPEKIDGYRLPDELLLLSEKLAKNVHEVWAEGRINEGWVFGEREDSVFKTTPCLVPYEELPESEKDYDRRTAISTLKYILKLGYKIERQVNDESK